MHYPEIKDYLLGTVVHFVELFTCDLEIVDSIFASASICRCVIGQEISPTLPTGVCAE